MRLRTGNPLVVMCWSVAISSAVGIALAVVVGSALVVIPMIYLDAGANILGFVWYISQESFGERLHRWSAVRTTLAAKIGYMFVIFGYNSMILFVAVVFAKHIGGKPCFCLTAPSLYILYQLTWTTLASAAFVNIGFLATLAMIYRIRYRPPVEPKRGQ